MHPYDAFQQKPFPRRRMILERAADAIGLNRFFLREGKRPHIQADEWTIVSPSDCKLSEIEALRPGKDIHGKNAFGRRENYSFEEIVHGDDASAEFEGGVYFNMYLSPLNLHYLLYPANLTVKRMEHHPAFCRPILFMRSGEIRNERLVIYCENSRRTPFIIVLVGSFLVSGVECLADVSGSYEAGGLMGGFKLGSTVLMLFPKGAVEPIAKPGDRLFFGEPMARFQDARS
ncbi:MAG: phosphatidylserine decarboxylase [Candidatus Omnitrophica bacterium]|nr:phosphatidylserine decarboxylase [Candidatus Omnitrophota bacterium]